MTKYIYCIITLFLLSTPSLANTAEDSGLAALTQAQESKKFLLAYFFDSADTAHKDKSFKSSIENASSTMGDTLHSVLIDVNDKTAQGLISKYQIKFAPKPIALIFSPAGTIIGSYQKSFTTEELASSLPGPGMQKCLQFLQEGKLVILSIQNDKSTDAQSALKAATEFSNDAQFKQYVSSVVIDPSSKLEINSLKQLQIGPGTTKAVTLLIAPPGSLVGKWEGALTKDLIATKLTQMMGQSGQSCKTPACKTSCETPESPKK